MDASKSHIVLAVWAATMLAGIVAAGGRSLLACNGKDSVGLSDCSCVVVVVDDTPPFQGSSVATGCPHDGQRYAVCLSGNAKGGCMLEAQGLFPKADCDFTCWFQSSVSAAALQAGLPTCDNAIVNNQNGTAVASRCPHDGQSYQVCLKGGDSLGLIDCTCIRFTDSTGPVSGFDLANGCPHDGQRYAVCLEGNAKGGCKLESQNTFPPADCAFNCWFQSGVSSSAPGELLGLPVCANAVVGNTPGTLKTTQCPRDGQVYQVCLLGNSKGGCKPLPTGPWPTADCTFACIFNTSAISG
ncbi:hypothetical protein COCOBI_18-1470 [Coccomyxa sp. Obi]|nr:hypothetical protein COCOBI_18-1470 [Coccomyxa sp. Obi]